PIDFQITPFDMGELVQKDAAKFPFGEALKKAIRHENTFAKKTINCRRFNFLRFNQRQVFPHSKSAPAIIHNVQQTWISHRQINAHPGPETNLSPNQTRSKQQCPTQPEPERELKPVQMSPLYRHWSSHAAGTDCVGILMFKF